MGVDEYVDLDLDEFQRRSTERLLTLVERSRRSIERRAREPFAVAESDGRVELTVGGRPGVRGHAPPRPAGLLITDVSGRYGDRL